MDFFVDKGESHVYTSGMSDTLHSSEIAVQVKVQFRNAGLVGSRKRLGYSQKKLAQITGVSIYNIGRLEKFDFSWDRSVHQATILADALDVELDDILPEALRGKSIQDTAVSVENIEPSRLLTMTDVSSRFILPSPADLAEQKDMIGHIAGIMKTDLAFRERNVLACRLGLRADGSVGDSITLRETGKFFNISQERVRQVERKAMNKVKDSLAKGIITQWPDDSQQEGASI